MPVYVPIEPEPKKIKLQKRLKLISDDANNAQAAKLLEKEEALYQEAVGRLMNAARCGNTTHSFRVIGRPYEPDPPLKLRLRKEGLEVNCSYNQANESEYDVSWGAERSEVPYGRSIMLATLAAWTLLCFSLAYGFIQYVAN